MFSPRVIKGSRTFSCFQKLVMVLFSPYDALGGRKGTGLGGGRVECESSSAPDPLYPRVPVSIARPGQLCRLAQKRL